MPKNWQTTEKHSRLNEAVSVLGAKKVLEARPDGLTSEECCALLMSNKVCASLDLARDYVKELRYSGRLQYDGHYYHVVKEEIKVPETPEEVKAVLDAVSEAKSVVAADKFSLQKGETTDEGVIEE